MALFNREINKRQVSNLQSFRIVLAPNKDALKHIDQIIHSAGQYEEGENLSVFDLTQSAEQDAKNEEAKEYLARLVAANHNQLGLKDLFELASRSPRSTASRSCTPTSTAPPPTAPP